jgi:glycosyltransferase involved in cell wall biosynthesis
MLRGEMNASLQSVEIVVPVFNEQGTLGTNIELLLAYLRAEFPFRFGIVIADNASVDATGRIARSLAARHDEVAVFSLDRRGRGLALKTAWLASGADVVSYMDVDLSTNLESFLPLVAPLLSGHSELAIGTRLAPSAHIRRRLRREILSRGYNHLVHLGFRAGFSDAQCGFKAIRTDVARRLLPLVEDEGWFFNTELLLVAERTATASTRCLWTGSRTWTRVSTSLRPSRPTCPGSGACGGSSGAAAASLGTARAGVVAVPS